MRQILLITGGLMVAVSVVYAFFALNQVNQEQLDLTSRLQSRSQVIADSLAESIGTSYSTRATSTMQRVIDRFVSNERLAGLGVFDSAGKPVVSSTDLPYSGDQSIVTTVMDSDEARGSFVSVGSETYYAQVTPLRDEKDRVIGALMVEQNATYINESIYAIWRDNLLRLLLQLVIIAGAIFVLVRFVFYRSITNVARSLEALRKGSTEDAQMRGGGLLEPLLGEISKVTTSLRQARHAASEEARMRLEKLDSPWTAERLKEFIKASLKDRPIFVVSNGEPYVSTKVKNKIEWSVPAGGVITAIEPIMNACGGTWIARGSGDADKETADDKGKLRVPPDEPHYTLRRIFLTPEEAKGYYDGYSNETLWPMCHMAHVRPQFRNEDWETYKKVNGTFAQTVLDEIRNADRPIVLIQDYHLALVPALIKRARPDADVAIFWHIPWPSPAQFSICPQRKEILDGMLGADLVGFHTQQYCNNFIDTVASEIESRIDYEGFFISREEHHTFVRPFPISIDFPGSAEPQKHADRSVLKEFDINAKHIVLGVDRLDYIKGIPERLRGIEFLLDTHPEYTGTFTFLQIASPTRQAVEKYQQYAQTVFAEAQRINEKFGTKTWQPIKVMHHSYPHETLRKLYQVSDVCLVTSLHDGMNLVAKEYVAARTDEKGVLILSNFTGASRDLKGALVINPYSAEETAQAVHRAFEMPKTEQHRRMKSMRDSVRDYNVYRWSAEIIKTLIRLD